MNEAAAAPVRISRRRRLFHLVRNILAVVGLLAIIYHLCFDLSTVVSNSMSPTLRGNGRPGSDWLLAENITYRFRSPRRWELVQFLSGDGILVTKRVVGLPGEVVSIREHQLVINGQIVHPPANLRFLSYYAYGNLKSGASVESGDGYFVLGDASEDSADSRFEGPIARDRIRARAWLIVRPISRFRWVTP